MSRLVIALGFADAKATTPPHLLYVGRDADAMRRACAESGFPVHQLFINPVGIRKHNPAAAANAARIASLIAAESGAAVEVNVSELVASNDALQAECMRLQKEIAALKVAAEVDVPDLIATNKALQAHLEALRANSAPATVPADVPSPISELPSPAAAPGASAPAAPKPGTRR